MAFNALIVYCNTLNSTNSTLQHWLSSSKVCVSSYSFFGFTNVAVIRFGIVAVVLDSQEVVPFIPF